MPYCMRCSHCKRVQGEEEDALNEMSSASNGPPILNNHANTNGGGAGDASATDDNATDATTDGMPNGGGTTADAVNGVMMPFGNPVTARPSGRNSLRSRYVDPLSSKSTSAGSTVSNTPNSSFKYVRVISFPTERTLTSSKIQTRQRSTHGWMRVYLGKKGREGRWPKVEESKLCLHCCCCPLSLSLSLPPMLRM